MKIDRPPHPLLDLLGTTSHPPRWLRYAPPNARRMAGAACAVTMPDRTDAVAIDKDWRQAVAEWIG